MAASRRSQWEYKNAPFGRVFGRNWANRWLSAGELARRRQWKSGVGQCWLGLGDAGPIKPKRVIPLSESSRLTGSRQSATGRQTGPLQPRIRPARGSSSIIRLPLSAAGERGIKSRHAVGSSSVIVAADDFRYLQEPSPICWHRSVLSEDAVRRT
jgi:hypothetical protein